MVDNVPQSYSYSLEEVKKELEDRANYLKSVNFLLGYSCFLDYISHNTISVVGKYNNFLISYYSVIHQVSYITVPILRKPNL